MVIIYYGLILFFKLNLKFYTMSLNYFYIAKRLPIFFLSIALLLLTFSQVSAQTTDSILKECILNAKLANEGFNRSVNYVRSWIKQADPSTGLIPRNLRESNDYWNAWDAAADNYPFMVLTSSILMPEFFRDTALRMLRTEEKLTSRLGHLPDTYSFTKKGFRNEAIDTSQMVFGAAEYMKDGLIPLTDWLGKSPWSDRMLGILEDLPKLASMAQNINGTMFGKSATVEVNGDLLQVLSRMYWFTGKEEYLDWAIAIADNYLNATNLPTVALDHLQLRDHGCEIISGLCETYLAVSYVMPEKRTSWRPFIHQMLDRILEIGRNEHGLFYDAVQPTTGKIISSRLADNFGYTLNAYWFVSEMDQVPAYKEAVLKCLGSLNQYYRNHDWESGSADGYADAIEGALNLYNRAPLPSVKEWLDSETQLLWGFQKSDGMIEGWHGDGNFARTTIMYCLWKTQGIRPLNWDPSLQLGAVAANGGVKIYVSHPKSWKGLLKFDGNRASTQMHFPWDYPRINQFQQWFTVDPTVQYRITNLSKGTSKIYLGKALLKGIPVELANGESVNFQVQLLK